MAYPAPNGECLVAVSAAAAVQIAAGRGPDELAVLAAFLTSLADNLALIAAQRSAQDAFCADQIQKNEQIPCKE